MSPPSLLPKLRAEIRAHANPRQAELLKRFFKTGPGQYGEGDRFYGIMVPVQRKIAKRFAKLSLKDIGTLLKSPYHEDRLIALFILTIRFERTMDVAIRDECARFYLLHMDRINNWDLVDVTAPRILGAWLADKPDTVFKKLVRSHNLWERRIAIVTTLYDIVHKNPRRTLELAPILLNDEHDLIHKATGWMLREVGKRCGTKILTDFLDEHADDMPRTMLRYAIERLPLEDRKAFLLRGNGKKSRKKVPR